MNPIGRDLKLLRTQKKFSLEEVYQLTKIPLHRLEGIENGRAFKELVKEPTVLRSFIRGYGKALGIPDQTMVEALDLDKTGRYSQELIEWVEKNKSWKATRLADAGKSQADSSTATVKKKTVRKNVISEDESEMVPSSGIVNSSKVETSFSKKGSKLTENSVEKTKSKTLFDQPPSTSKALSIVQNPLLPNVAPEAPAVEQIDWAGKKISTSQFGNTRIVFIIVIALILLTVLAGVIWGVSRLFSGDKDNASQDQIENSSGESTPGYTSSPGPARIDQGETVSLPVPRLTGGNQSPSAGRESFNNTQNQTNGTSQAANAGTNSRQSGDAQPESQSSSTNPTSSATETSSPSDFQNTSIRSTQAPFEVLIYAYNGPVGTLQFSLDENENRRNVRLAQGEAFRVQPDQQIRFDGAFSSMIVFINGEPIDNFQELFFDRRQRQVVLTRELLDGLSNSNPRDLRLPRGVTPPASIRELP